MIIKWRKNTMHVERCDSICHELLLKYTIEQQEAFCVIRFEKCESVCCHSLVWFSTIYLTLNLLQLLREFEDGIKPSKQPMVIYVKERSHQVNQELWTTILNNKFDNVSLKTTKISFVVYPENALSILPHVQYNLACFETSET